MSGERMPVSIGAVVLGAGALLLSAVMLVGFLLPTDWEAEATAVLSAEPEAVFSYLDAPEGWRAWTTWPDSGLVREGPERGVGALVRWNDPELGSGSFQVVDARPPSFVSYAVEVSDGAMRTTGSIEVQPAPGGSRVTWHEEGDLGRNPLMGFWAFFMSRAQTTELEKSLERLGAAAGGSTAAPAPRGTANPARDSLGSGSSR